MRVEKCNGKGFKDGESLFSDTKFMVFDEKYNKIFKKASMELLELKFR